MSKLNRVEFNDMICKAAKVGYATQIDPAKLQQWIALILQFLPSILALFSSPTPTPAPAPVQAGPSITTVDGLLDFVEKSIELHGLTEEQQQKVLAAVESMAAFLTM